MGNNIFASMVFTIEIEIFAEDISDVNIERMSNHLQRGLLLLIDCKLCHSDGTVKNIKILFDLSDEIIDSVGKGIKELSERNKNGNFCPL
jgi:hypothetical protein